MTCAAEDPHTGVFPDYQTPCMGSQVILHCGNGQLPFLSPFTVLVLASASGEFVVLHAPNHVNFRTSASPLPLSEVPDVISSSLGHQLNHVRNLLFSSISSSMNLKWTTRETSTDHLLVLRPYDSLLI